MKVSIDHLLLLVKEHGAEKALRYINVDDIEDHDAKVIARTIKFSGKCLRASSSTVSTNAIPSRAARLTKTALHK